MISIEDIYKLYLHYPHVCTDTRSIKNHCLFFCLKGNNFNGNTFALQALKNGAAYVIVDEKEYTFNERCILVSDVLQTLQDLARYHRKQLNIPVIGITGTNGKTTTKELMAAVLSSSYKILATKGNLNNHIGVPLTILSINKDVEIAIIEMGANHTGEIDFLCEISKPTLGIITNIGKAHMEGFQTIDTIIETKTALYRSIKKTQGTLFVNSDDNVLIQRANQINKITYGKHINSNHRGEPISNSFHSGVYLPKYKSNIISQLTGEYNFYNIMAAITVGLFFNISIDKIQTSIASYTPTNSRSQVIKKGNNILIMDAYNANPSSVEVAIENFANIEHPRKVVMLGDMKELGSISLSEHQTIVNMLKKLSIDEVYLVGNEFYSTNYYHFHAFKNFDEAAIHIKQANIQDAIILIKGSRGMEMERIINYL